MKNTVELVGMYGGDETHALSAWTSTSRELTLEKRARMGKLLKQLADDDHGSVFEKSALHFLLTVDVVTHYQLLKHRIGVSINAESARYKELKDDKYYVPEDWDLEEQTEYVKHIEATLQRYHTVLARLKAKGVSAKRAKETARFYLPCGNQLTLDIQFNFRSFFHFIKLRYSIHSQKEIQNLARDMLLQVANLPQFKLTLLAFNLIDEHGKICEPFQ